MTDAPDFESALYLLEKLREPAQFSPFALQQAAAMHDIVSTIVMLCNEREPVPDRARDVAAAIDHHIAHDDVESKPLQKAVSFLAIGIFAAQQTYIDGRPASDWRGASITGPSADDLLQEYRDVTVVSIEQLRHLYRARHDEPPVDPA